MLRWAGEPCFVCLPSGHTRWLTTDTSALGWLCRLLRTSTKMFSNLASQSVQLSLSSSVLYPAEEDDKDQLSPSAASNRGIRFTEGGKELDADLSALRREIFGDDGAANAN